MDESTHLVTLRKCLAQCEEALPEIHDHHDRQIMEEHADLLRADIRRMEVRSSQSTPVASARSSLATKPICTRILRLDG